jgi:hypothetical protein
LAIKGKILGRKLLGQVGTLFTPDTILRWHRLLVARKWDYSNRRQKKPGRLALSQEIQDLVVRFAQENLRGVMTAFRAPWPNVGHEISDTSVANILKEQGIEPAPQRRRQSTWKTFLQAHWEVLAAVDFTTVEIWTKNGLITACAISCSAQAVSGTWLLDILCPCAEHSRSRQRIQSKTPR